MLLFVISFNYSIKYNNSYTTSLNIQKWIIIKYILNNIFYVTTNIDVVTMLIPIFVIIQNCFTLVFFSIYVQPMMETWKGTKVNLFFFFFKI